MGLGGSWSPYLAPGQAAHDPDLCPPPPPTPVNRTDTSDRKALPSLRTLSVNICIIFCWKLCSNFLYSSFSESGNDFYMQLMAQKDITKTYFLVMFYWELFGFYQWSTYLIANNLFIHMCIVSWQCNLRNLWGSVDTCMLYSAGFPLSIKFMLRITIPMVLPRWHNRRTELIWHVMGLRVLAFWAPVCLIRFQELSLYSMSRSQG